MADNVAVTAGSGTTVAADEVVDGTLGTVKVQYVKLMDGTLDGTTKAAVGALGLAVNASHASGSIASGAIASGAVASGAFASGSIASGAVASGAMVDLGAIADAAVTAGATGSVSAKLRSISRDIVANIVLAAGSAIIGLVKLSDGTNTATVKAASTAPVATDTAAVVAIHPLSVNANGQAVMASSAPVTLSTDQKYQTGMSPRAFSAAFSTLTRAANTTAYSALDSISDNATPGSVTALTATVSDTNSDPLTITEILISSTDTGLAGKKIRAYLYNSDPTASTGVVGGDNLAFSNKKAGYIGSLSGLLETGFSDGTVGRLVPTFADGAASPLSNAGANSFIVTAPSAAGKALWIQYQAIDGFTPSANSTTIIGTVRGFQGRAA